MLHFVCGGYVVNKSPNKRSDVYEAVVVAAIEIDNDGLAIDGFVRDRGGIYPESLVNHNYVP
jgi:hypothetical protein